MFEMNCPHCNHYLRIPDQFAGKQGTCKNCGKTITAPGQHPSPPDSRIGQPLRGTSPPPMATDLASLREEIQPERETPKIKSSRLTTTPVDLDSATQRQHIVHGILLATAAILGILWMNFDTTPAPPTAASDLHVEAFVWSQGFVTQNLKSPGSADFPFLDFKAQNMGDFNYRVTSYVDAQNVFGAKVRVNYSCMMTYKPQDDRWTCTDLVMDQQ